eukprot:15312221-Alexandrium_andersonii.AAC.1
MDAAVQGERKPAPDEESSSSSTLSTGAGADRTVPLNGGSGLAVAGRAFAGRLVDCSASGPLPWAAAPASAGLGERWGDGGRSA